eukprot:526906-Rhodomonas_salina.1
MQQRTACPPPRKQPCQTHFHPASPCCSAETASFRTASWHFPVVIPGHFAGRTRHFAFGMAFRCCDETAL